MISEPAIASRVDAVDGKPAATYRYAGDRALLVEYPTTDFDLSLNFFVLAVDGALREREIEGVVESAVGFHSILVTYDPLVIAAGELVDALHAIYLELPAARGIVIPSRLVSLPIAFDDSQTRAAVAQYAQRIRADAPNCEGGNNIDYVVRYNGLTDRDELYETALASEQWAAFMGFFPGLPFLFPLDPRHVVFVPKYNPTRTWTPEGAFGLGGPCFTIYPVESPGGYQLIGRSLPIYDIQARNRAFRDTPLLMRAGDRIRFHRVSEEELLELWSDVHADRYRYVVEEGDFDVGAYLEWLPAVADEAAERRSQRERAAAASPVP